MAYTTVSDVRTNSGFTDSLLVADAVITAKITYADGLINSKIASRYTIPLAIASVASTPKLIEMLSLEMATVLLLMAQYSEQAQDTDKGWERRLKMVQESLDDIASGKSKLFNDSGVEYGRSSTDTPSFYPTTASREADADPHAPRLFTMGKVF